MLRRAQLRLFRTPSALCSARSSSNSRIGCICESKREKNRKRGKENYATIFRSQTFKFLEAGTDGRGGIELSLFGRILRFWKKEARNECARVAQLSAVTMILVKSNGN